MKQKLLLKSLLLLCALVGGVSSAWADNITYTFTNKSWAATVDDGSANWSSGKEGNQFQSGRGVQITTGASGANATSPTSINNISKIVVTYSTNASAGVGSIAFQVGNGEAKSQNVTKTGGTTDRTLTYNFSPNETGNVKITVTCTTNSIYVKSVTITYSNVVKEANQLAWSAASKDVTYSETPYNLPTLSNPHSLAVTYDSSDKSIATLDAEGNVTIKNVTGSTTISASTEGDATYAAGTVSYTLNVTRKVIIEDGVFDFSLGSDYGSGVANGNDIIANESKTWTAGNIVMTVANRFAWATSNQLKLYKAVTGVEAGEITITCPAGKAITQIDFTGPYTGTGALSNIAANTGNYTVTSSSAIWTGASQSVSFTASNSTYINTITVTYGTTVPVTLNTSGYATFAANTPLDFSDDSEFSAWQITGANSTSGLITFSQIPGAVAAGTGVLLKGEASATVNIPVAATGTDLSSTNKLEGITEATPVTADQYYGLLDDGFVKVNAGTVPAGKALLPASLVDGASRLTFVFEGEATGVQELKSSRIEGLNSCYDLQGRRVSQPTRGLYIQNGRKVLVK